MDEGYAGRKQAGDSTPSGPNRAGSGGKLLVGLRRSQGGGSGLIGRIVKRLVSPRGRSTFFCICRFRCVGSDGGWR